MVASDAVAQIAHWCEHHEHKAGETYWNYAFNRIFDCGEVVV